MPCRMGTRCERQASRLDNGKDPHFCVYCNIARGTANHRKRHLWYARRSGLSRSGHRKMPFLGGVQLSLWPRRLSLSARKAQSADQGIAAAQRRSAQAHGAVAWAVAVKKLLL